MEVVYGVQDNEWLVKLLRGMIFGAAGGEKDKKVRSGTAHVERRMNKRRASVDKCSVMWVYEYFGAGVLQSVTQCSVSVSVRVLWGRGM